MSRCGNICARPVTAVVLMQPCQGEAVNSNAFYRRLFRDLAEEVILTFLWQSALLNQQLYVLVLVSVFAIDCCMRVCFSDVGSGVRPITMHCVSWPIRVDCACQKEGLCIKRKRLREAGHTIMYSIWKIMCLLNIKAWRHILLHQIMIFKKASYDPFKAVTVDSSVQHSTLKGTLHYFWK